MTPRYRLSRIHRVNVGECKHPQRKYRFRIDDIGRWKAGFSGSKARVLAYHSQYHPLMYLGGNYYGRDGEKFLDARAEPVLIPFSIVSCF